MDRRLKPTAEPDGTRSRMGAAAERYTELLGSDCGHGERDLGKRVTRLHLTAACAA